jgi:hypothetical protein
MEFYSADIDMFMSGWNTLYLFGHIKEQLAGRPILDEQDLKTEKMAILTGFSEDEESRAFNHWIE